MSYATESVVHPSAKGSKGVQTNVYNLEAAGVVAGSKMTLTSTAGAGTTDLAGTVTSSGTTLTGTSTAFLTELTVGSIVVFGGDYHEIASITSDTVADTVVAFDPALSGATLPVDGGEVVTVEKLAPFQNYIYFENSIRTAIDVTDTKLAALAV